MTDVLRLASGHRAVARTCKACGANFLARETYVANGNGDFCSAKCRGVNLRSGPPETWFWNYVQKTDGCWLWTAARQRHGYGVTSVHRKTVRAHRLSWELSRGPIPVGSHVLHACDNPPCVNPDHLFLGTEADNALDKARKGRTGVAKLTPDNVRSIRALAADGDRLIDIAAHYGVATSVVSDVVARRLWAHVDGDGKRVSRKRRSQRRAE